MARTPRLMSDSSSTPRANRSKKQEKQIASDVGGKTTPGSGNQWHSKGDVKSDAFLIEAKRSDNRETITVKVSDLAKIRIEALMEGKSPVLQIELGNGDKYAIVPWTDFLSITE